MKTIIILIALMIPASALAFDPWARQDIALEATWQVLHVIDWGQTVRISRQPQDYHEMNPILGRHPSEGRVNTYMALSALTHMAITHVLPKSCRPYWQGVTLILTTGCVANNFGIGLGFGW